MVDAPGRRDEAVVQESREAGLRVTMAREAALNWLTVHPHSTAGAGLPRRIEPAGHSARFEQRAGDSHCRVVCRSCGRTEDTGGVAGERRPCLEPVNENGFVIDEAEVIFWGLCPSCRAEGGPDGGTPDLESGTRPRRPGGGLRRRW